MVLRCCVQACGAVAVLGLAFSYRLVLEWSVAHPLCEDQDGEECQLVPDLVRSRRNKQLLHLLHKLPRDHRSVVFNTHMLDYAAGRFAEKATSGGKKPVYFHIGPMDLSKPGELDDLQEMAKQWSPKLLFVEANPAMVRRLRKRLGEPAFESSQASVLDAAACPEAAGAAPFYRVSENITREFPRLRLADFAQVSSLDRESTVSGVLGLFHEPGANPQYSWEEWQSFVSYVEAVEVRCLTPESLFTEMGVDAEDIDTFIVDAEGFDNKLVNQALALHDFRPAFIEFKYCCTPRQLQEGFVEGNLTRTVRELKRSGYDVYQLSVSVVAVLPPKGSREQNIWGGVGRQAVTHKMLPQGARDWWEAKSGDVAHRIVSWATSR